MAAAARHVPLNVATERIVFATREILCCWRRITLDDRRVKSIATTLMERISWSVVLAYCSTEQISADATNLHVFEILRKAGLRSAVFIPIATL